jgi:ligand-binding SRPBCC domain-containing protein
VFAFFADAANLEALTPPFLGFQIKSPLPIAMRPGAVIDYQIRLYRLPMRWRTLIEAFVPGESFIDSQVRGPYRVWRHEHRFTDTAGGGTEITDQVDYDLPLPPLGRIAHVWVRRTLRQIFDYRHQIVAARFA